MTTTQVPAEVHNLLAQMIDDFHKTEMRTAALKARENPAAYRDSNVMEGGKLQFHYYTAPKSALPGHRVAFCYSQYKNIAGYYLSWTETWKGDKGRRTNFHGWETKRAAIDYCLHRLKDSRKPKGERRYILPRI